jgi:adenylate cyclase
MKFFSFDRNRLIGLLISLALTGVIGLLYTQTILMDGMERGATDLFFVIRDPGEKSKKLEDAARQFKLNPKARKDIVILGIDEETIRAFAQKGRMWPFKWDVYAQFTRYVSSGDPLALFYDIMFIDPRKQEEKHMEEEFADAIREAGNVFLDFPFEVTEIDKKYSDLPERMELANRHRVPARKDGVRPWVEEALPPLPILARPAEGVGFANVRPDPDHTNRKMPLYVKFKDHYYPNIDLLVVMHYYGIDKKDLEIRPGKHIKLKNLPKEKMARPNPERTVTIPIDQEGFMDINFIGGTDSFLNYPFYLFHREGTMKNNTSLKDKLLLVAAYSVTGIAKDVHKSPYGEMFGIEHHANAINTILNQDFIYKFDQKQNLIILLVIALLLGFLLPRVSIIASVIITVVAGLLYLTGAYFLFDRINLVTTVTTPVIQIGATFTLIIAYRVMTEQKEKRYIRNTFSKFVSKSVVDDLLKHPDKLKLGGEKKILTVMFSDIRSFTTLSESMTPEELVEQLNQYLQAMTEIVIKYDGTLDKYVGDEIMAFWGAPIPMEDHALRACRCAIEQMDVLAAMNKEWQAQGKKSLHIGIGINTGDMVVGNMGSSSRMDYTLMGDNVNLGARLEGTNKVYSTGIIISEFTYDHVKDDVIVRELDLIRVKGKERPVRIYELVDVK